MLALPLAGQAHADGPGPAPAVAAEPAANPEAISRKALTPTVERTPFDHFTTTFELVGKHRDVPCEQCHVNALFKGTPHDCAACHGLGVSVRAVGKPVNHILSTNRCESCHTAVSFNPAVDFDHADVLGTCSSCHFRGGPAQAQSPTHIATDLECDACHSTIGWSGAVGASLPANHLPTSQPCSLCHANGNDFSVAVMSHQGIATGCATCHAAGLAFANMAPPVLVQPPANHIPFGTSACEGCHLATNTSTGGFAFTNASTNAPAGMVHSATSTGACATCHAAGLAWAGTPATVTLPAGHVATGGAECTVCHAGTTTFRFTNASGTAPPAMVHAAVAQLACSGCHERGVVDIGVPATVVRPLLKASGAPHVAGGECSTCHFNTTSFKGATDLPTNHLPLLAPATVSCLDCHAGAPADYSTYLMDHADVTTACSTCHAAGKAFANMAAPVLRVPPANHVPFGAAECTACHAAGNFSSFAMANTSASSPPAMVHAGVPGTACATCHGPGLAWAGTPATITSSNTNTGSPHIPLPGGVACEGCHAAASTLPGGFSFANASGGAPPSMVHGLVASIACDQCHGAGKLFAGSPAVVTIANRAAAHVPVPAGTGCTSCHSGSNFASFAFANASTAAAPGMVHSAVAATACSTCHERGLSWLGSPATVLRPVLKASGQAHVTTGECSDCHLNTTSFKGASDLPANHIPLPAADNNTCTLCHASAPDYTQYAMSHANIAGNCAQCHAAGLSFAGIASPALRQPPSNHVPSGTAACEGCHAANNFTAFAMPNASSAAPPGMVHALVAGKACAACHATGLAWVGLPATLTPGNPGAAGPHVPLPAGAACEGCHLASSTATGGFAFNNAAGTAAPSMVHTLVATLACSGCHERGMIDLGVPATVVRPLLKASGAPHVPSGECSTCHFNTTSFKGASDLPTNHIPLLAPTTVNCLDCHAGAPADYSTYAMNHADASTACTTCHAAGKGFQNMAPPVLRQPPANHVPSGATECSACHSAINFSTFQMANTSASAPPAMVHSGGTACATCHGASLAWVGAPATLTSSNTGTANPHVPLPAGVACEGCHLAANVLPGGFAFPNASGSAPAAMVHALVAAIACDQCHSAGKAFAGSPATRVVPANHVPFPAGTACTTCHAAGNFASFVFANLSTTAAPGMVHSGVAATACSTCHEKGLGWAGSPATVLRPATKASGLPHVTTGECSTCHFSTTSFKGASDLPGNHIPLPAADNGNCLLCHANAPDYSTYAMNHANIASGCAQCHAAGLAFANMAPPVLRQPPANHVPFGAAPCEACHLASSTSSGGFAFTNASKAAPPGMVHAAANTAACSTCHAAGLAWAGTPATVTLPATHVAIAGAECTVCHAGTTTFKFGNATGTAPPAMVHAAVATLACSGCHERGKTDIGVPATVVRPLLKASGAPHITTGECSTCHFNTTSFKGATDLPTNHIPLLAPATVNCLDCHAGAPADYSTYAMNHADVAASCSTCHAAGRSFQNMAPPVLKVPPANHVPFGTAECSTCHSATGFSSFQMTNTSAAAPPAMVHAVVPGTACATCHAAGLGWAGAPATVTSSNTNTASPHVPLPSGVACEGCHSAGSTLPGGFSFANASGSAPPAMVHGLVASIACDQCHGAGKVFAGAPAIVTPANRGLPHVPFPASAACTNCHSATAFGTFSFANASTTAPAGMVHSVVTATACSTCHERGLSWLGSPATLLRPLLKANGQSHVSTGECSTCHFNTTSFKGASDLPANHIPLPAADNNTCTLCHAAAPDYAQYAMNHANIAGNCAQCHASGLAFAGIAAPTLKQPPANHVPFGTAACEACHAPGNFTTFLFANRSGTAPPAMVHAAVPGSACAACHGAGLAWAGTPATLTLSATGTASPHIPLPAGAACEGCHLAGTTATGGFAFANASGASPPAMVHAAVASMPCDQCHGAGKAFAGAPAVVTTSNRGSAHVPFPAGTACTGCHAAGTFASFAFANASTTAPSGMVHALVASIACSTCHEKGLAWLGSPATLLRPLLKANGQQHVAAGECSTCHFNTTSFKGATDLPANHLPLPAADNNNCTLCHSNANDYSVGTMNHVNIATNCAQCHAAGKSFANMAPPTLVLVPAGHVPFGTAACEACHLAGSTATGGFKFTSASTTAPAGMVHSAVTALACAACHASANTWLGSPKPPPANHVPYGTAACEGCHLATATATGGWKFNNASGTTSPAMVHAAVTVTACEQCHGPNLTWAGTPATVTTTNRSLAHVPYPAGTACTTCHAATNFTSFAFANASTTAAPGMLHTAVASIVCSTCHEAGKTWLGSPVTKVRPALKANGQPHVTTGECSTCHFNTTSFRGATDLPANHIPLPTADNSNCSLCHSNAGDYSVYAMNHVNITSNCIQCHGYGLSFANMAPPTLKAPPSGATGHIPSNKPNGTSDIACELCHTPTVFTTFAGTVMKHAYVKAMTCMSCHELGMAWKTNTGVRLWVRDGANHHAGQDCGGSGCHSTRDKFAPRRAVALSASQKATNPTLAGGKGGASMLGGGAGVNHQRLLGTACVSCHSASSGTGKLAGHMATTDRCESCHSTGNWSPVLRVDHTQVVGSCASCHDGRVARGKSASHVGSGTNCASCHTTLAWTPARFDHAAVAAHTCTTCHDSLHAIGKPLNHVPTSAQCDTCHGTLGWKPALMDHTTLTARCATCHNNNVALGVPVGHMGTQRDCATCHSYPDWAAMHFVHASAAYPGDHRAAPACVACHAANTDQVAWASPADAGSCGGCHAKDFKPARHPKVAGGAGYTASELHDCSGACHVYTDATLGTVGKSLPGPYHRAGDAAFRH